MDTFCMSSLFDGKDDFKEAMLKRPPRLSTGFNNIDILLQGGLNTEFYIMTAETSIGKSALMATMAGNMAAAGNNILYFSYEMGKNEFNARGISSQSFRAHLSNPGKPAYKSGDILNWTYDKTLQDFTIIPYGKYEEYAEIFFDRYGRNFYIVEAGLERISAKAITEIVSGFKETHPDKPLVVFVDYLQLISADGLDSSQNDRKTKIDVAVKTLKGLSISQEIPVFTVSSVGRNEYGKGQSIGSAKESGDAEYTAGVLIGWDWTGVTDAKNKEDALKEIKESENRGYRKMKFAVLKNRNAERDTSAELFYYPAYNFFTEKNPEHYSNAELVNENDTEDDLPFQASDEDEWPDFPDDILHV